MYMEERQDQIKELFNEKKSISVADLAKIYEVSEATIRRDLHELDEKGILRRTHGGAVSIEGKAFEPSFIEKEIRQKEEKKRIGAFAASMVKSDETIILDSGTTTLEIARRLKEVRHITVVTNSILIAKELSMSHEIELILTGGTLRGNTMALVGPLAEDVLRNFQADKVFIATNGVTVKEGLTTPNLTEARTKAAMLKAGKQAILVADSTKVGVVSFVKFASISDIATFITDTGLSDKSEKMFEKKGIEVFSI